MRYLFYLIAFILFPIISNAQIKSYYKYSDEQEKYLYGFKDSESGDILIEAKYHKVRSYFSDLGFSLVQIDDKYGVVNKYGKEIVPVIYTRVFLDKGYVRVKKGGGYYNDERGSATDGKYGLYDSIGKVIIEPAIYDYLGKPSSGLLRANLNGIDYLSSGGTFSGEDVEITGGKWGFVNINGRRAIPFKYTYAYNFRGDVAQVYVGGTNNDWVYGGEWNYVNKDGNLIISEGLQKEEAIKNGIVIVSETKEEWIRHDDGYREKFDVKYYGAVNTEGEFVLKPKYKNIEILIDKFFLTEDKKSNVEFLDIELNKVFDFEIESANSLKFNSKSYLKIKPKNSSFGLYDENGNKILDNKYDEIERTVLMNQEYLELVINDKTGLINTAFEKVLSVEYDDIDDFADFYPDFRFIVKKNGKWGKVNSKNEILIPFEYDELKPTEIENGQKVYWVEKAGKQGLINENNEEVLKIAFDEIPDNYNIRYSWEDNRIIVKINGKQALINNKSEFLFPAKYTEINVSKWKENRVEVKSEKGQKGLCDTLGNILIELKYEKLFFGPEMFLCKSADSYELINVKNRKVIGQYSDYDSYGGFHLNNDFIALLKKDGKYGYVNAVTGDIVIDFIFDEIMNDNFYCGVNRVKIGEKYGLINNKAEIVFEAEFNELERKGACTVDAEGVSSMNFEAKKRRKWGVVNKYGEIVVDFKYRKHEDLPDL